MHARPTRQSARPPVSARLEPLEPGAVEDSRRSLEALERPPRVSWETLRAKLVRDWKPGEHFTLLGPTGTGKTHAALVIADLSRYVLVIVTKRRDPLMEQLAVSHGYRRVHDLEEDVLWTPEGQPLYPRLIFWPQAPSKLDARGRRAFQAREIRKALEWADRTGNWTLVLDELMWASNMLRLEQELESIYFQARTQGVSLIGAAQRPRQVPLMALNQSTYLLLWQTSDSQDVERLRELSAGFPRRLIEQAVTRLNRDEHEALFVDARRQELARIVMPAEIP